MTCLPIPTSHETPSQTSVKTFPTIESFTLTPKEVAALLKMSYRTVLDLLKRGRIRYARLGRRFFIHKDHIQHLFDAPSSANTDEDHQGGR